MLNKLRSNKGLIFHIIRLLILIIYFCMLLSNSFLNRTIQISIFILIFLFELLTIYELKKSKSCIRKENCKDILKVYGEYTKNIKNLNREQRHDWMNFLQVIYGYMQLGKYDMASRKISDLTQVALSISKVYRLTITPICLMLERKIKEAYSRGIKLIFNVENYSQSSYRKMDNLRYIMNSLEYIIDKILEYSEHNYREINIDVFEYINKLEVIIKGEFDLEFKSEFLNNVDIKDNFIRIEFQFIGITEIPLA